MDLSKAFDTINHEILCEKLRYYGIRDIALDWINSYLENQTQFVQFGSSWSYNRKISCGVPQGSILGTLLFIVYVNDLPTVFSLSQSYCVPMILVFFVLIRILINSFPSLLTNLTKISIWLKANKLSLNLSKTDFMFFHPRRKKINAVLENTVIKQVTETKILGVLIDHHLSWKPHISLVSKTIWKSTGIIATEARFYLSSKTLLSLYYSLVYPCLVSPN